jgi:hypothetical protein
LEDADDIAKPRLETQLFMLQNQQENLRMQWMTNAQRAADIDEEITDLKAHLENGKTYFATVSKTTKETERERQKAESSRMEEASAATVQQCDSVINEEAAKYGIGSSEIPVFGRQVKANVSLALQGVINRYANPDDAPHQDIEAFTRRAASEVAQLMKLAEAKKFTQESRAKADANEKMRTPGQRSGRPSSPERPLGPRNYAAEAAATRKHIDERIKQIVSR